MIVLQTVYGVALVLAWLLKLDQLRRWGPSTTRVLITLYLTALGVKLVLSVRPVVHGIDALVAPGSAKAGQMIVTTLAMWILISFFLSATGSVRRIRWELVPALTVAVIEVTALFSEPRATRAIIVERAHDGGLPALVLTLTGNLYTAYGLAVAVLAARRFARTVTDPHTRTGLVMTATGIVGAFTFAPIEQAVSVVIRFSGGAVAPGLDFAAFIIATGFTILVLAGLSYPEPARVAAGWRWRRRVLRGLQPLWARLQPEFPDVTLDDGGGSDPGGVLDRVDPRRVLWRYERRRVECRDALWELGSWIAEPVPGAADGQGAAVLDALRRRSEGVAPTAVHRTVADPADDSPRAEDRALLDLAADVERAARVGPRQEERA